MVIANIHVYIFIFISVVPYVTTATRNAIRGDVLSHPNWKLLERNVDCGKTDTYRIVGGDNARLGQYPWIVRLAYKRKIHNKEKNVFECGGTIISEKYILTAAHCGPKKMGIPLISVRLGEHNVYKDPDCDRGVCAPPVQDIQVEEHKCHEHYNTVLRQNDICLLRLASPIRFNDFVSPICLPVYEMFQRTSYEGKTLEIAGWGIRDIFLKKTSAILQTIMVKIRNHPKCVAMYRNKGAMISSKQICAGGVIGKDSCNGDSGGPLMAPFSVESPPKYFIIGVVSFGPTECADTDMPGIYTSVSDYILWILDNIRE